MPTGLDVTVPYDPYTFDTLRVLEVEKVAVTFRASVMTTMQVPVAFTQAPLQPVKTEPLAADAVRVTVVCVR